MDDKQNPIITPLPRFEDVVTLDSTDSDESGVWHYGVSMTPARKPKLTMIEEIDALVDQSESIAIRVGRVDAALGTEVHNNAMAWRALAQKAAGITDDGLDALARKTDG